MPVLAGGCATVRNSKIMTLEAYIGDGTPTPPSPLRRRDYFLLECKENLSRRKGQSLPWKYTFGSGRDEKGLINLGMGADAFTIKEANDSCGIPLECAKQMVLEKKGDIPY